MLSTDFLCGGRECRLRTSHTHLSCQDTESCDYFQVSTFQFTEMLRYAEDLSGRGGELRSQELGRMLGFGSQILNRSTQIESLFHRRVLGGRI